MTFVKGQSGNPRGRPKKDAEVAEVSIVKDGTSESARVSAASVILDRGWGKAPQTVDLNVNDDNYTDISDAELYRIANSRSAGIAGKTESPNKPH